MTYSINNILPLTEKPFISTVKHPGSLKFNEIFVYGVEDNMLESLSSEYYNPADYPKDPFHIGKNYGPKDLLKILSDASDYSQTEDPYDRIKLIPSNPNNKTMISSNVYNFVVSEGLRGKLFSKVPDDVNFCFIDGEIPQIDNIIEENVCKLKLRARVMGSVYKFPGLR